MENCNFLKAAAYLFELQKWSSKTSLLSSTDKGKIFSRHFLDSIQFLKSIPQSSFVMDMGSGNGFPSVPMALFRPDLRVFSFEAKSKKTIFLNHIKKILQMDNLSVVNIRIEENPSAFKNYFDVIVARAFAQPTFVFQSAQHYVKKSHIFFFYNALNDSDEIKESYQDVIHTVDKYVYKLADDIIRYITILKCVKEINF